MTAPSNQARDDDASARGLEMIEARRLRGPRPGALRGLGIVLLAGLAAASVLGGLVRAVERELERTATRAAHGAKLAAALREDGEEAGRREAEAEAAAASMEAAGDVDGATALRAEIRRVRRRFRGPELVGDFGLP